MPVHKVRATRSSTARIDNDASNNSFVRENITHDVHDNNNDAKPVKAARFKATRIEVCQITGIFRWMFDVGGLSQTFSWIVSQMTDINANWHPYVRLKHGMCSVRALYINRAKIYRNLSSVSNLFSRRLLHYHSLRSSPPSINRHYSKYE